jgi:type VI secretion system protein ImpK
MVQATQVTQEMRLSELAGDVLAFAVHLRESAEPETERLRADVRRLLSAFDAAAQVAGKEPAVVDAARYALVAFIDEIVLSSPWGIRQEWAGRPLQMDYFNDFTAGEEFFHKLEALRGSDGQRAEALEVYGLALGLGFRGKFAGVAGAEQVHQLRARIYAEIAPEIGAQPLSPHWEVEEKVVQLVKRVPAWVYASIALGALLLVFVVLRVWLEATETGFLQDLQELQELESARSAK